MEYEYIIEVTMPDTEEIYYLTIYNDLTKNPQCAMRFRKNSEEAEYKLNHLSRDLNPRLIDRRQIIGTYISPFPFNHTRSGICIKIQQIIEDSNILIILSLPILLPIVFILSIKDKIKEYVTNNR